MRPVPPMTAILMSALPGRIQSVNVQRRQLGAVAGDERALLEQRAEVPRLGSAITSRVSPLRREAGADELVHRVGHRAADLDRAVERRAGGGAGDRGGDVVGGDRLDQLRAAAARRRRRSAPSAMPFTNS